MSRFHPRHTSSQESPSPQRCIRAAAAVAGVMAALPMMAHAQDAAQETPTVTVNVFNERHPISPYIYGGNFPDTKTDFIEKTGTRLSRYGGNILSSHNWKLRLRNICADWYFENHGDEYTPDWARTVQKHGSAAIVNMPESASPHSSAARMFSRSCSRMPRQRTLSALRI